ncbi:membrane protein [Sporosarcina sp. NCCP-2716]|uniref:hypothetical protein n=1 Tax=Sporosarcina sp. NCCP-2716 TaxID=2943679 RepID=UPI00203B346A|nr:hypothetical protein [Sporosarcina sp. NCCP-2716]GKV68959.1 membrane protein [Sporosarcina sp. NCCP-2716]
MDDKTMKRIAQYEVKSDDAQKRLVVELGKRAIHQNQLHRYSMLNLFGSSLRFTRLRTWLIQVVLLLVTAVFITKAVNTVSSVLIIQCVTVVLVFSAIFFMEEVFHSVTTGMWELEQTLKYDLRQHTAAKLLIFGAADLCLIVCLAFICQGVAMIPFWHIFLYLLVPFNITCIVLLSLFTIWRNRLTSFVFWIGAGLLLMGFVIIISAYNIYEFSMLYWGIGFTVSAIWLGLIVMGTVKQNKWEAFYECNWN